MDGYNLIFSRMPLFWRSMIFKCWQGDVRFAYLGAIIFNNHKPRIIELIFSDCNVSVFPDCDFAWEYYESFRVKVLWISIVRFSAQQGAL